jgi:hypothetical protein
LQIRSAAVADQGIAFGTLGDGRRMLVRISPGLPDCGGPHPLGDGIGTSSLLAPRNPAVYVAQIVAACMTEALATTRYFDVTRATLR